MLVRHLEEVPMRLLRTGFSRRLVLVLALALILLFVLVQHQSDHQAAHAAGGTPIYGTCTGAKQGVIKGDVTAKHHEGQWAITSLTHGVDSPRDPATGQVTGRRRHQPISFTMNVDRATAGLLQALVSNERLTSCRFDFYKASRGVHNYFRIELQNAEVASYALKAHQSGTDDVTFALSYQRITWTDVLNNVSVSDDWSSPAN